VADFTSVDTRDRLLSEGEGREARRANIRDTVDGGFTSGFSTFLSSDDFLDVLGKEFATCILQKKTKNNSLFKCNN